MKRFLHIVTTYKLFFLLLLILCTAALFRFYNLNWDQGNFFHPDERNIDNAVAKVQFFSQLNPGFFAYGGFSIYLYKAAGVALSFITKNNEWMTNWDNINIVGRFFSALFSTITMIPLYFLARKIGNKKVALISCVLYTFTASSIQMAHYGVTESLFTFTGVLLCFLSLELISKPTFWRYLVIGILLGVAGATKTTELFFCLFLFTAQIVLIIKQLSDIKRLQLFFFVALCAGVVTFTIFSPYTFISWDAFMQSMHYESGVATGALSVPYTLQFNGTIPYLFQLKNFLWQMGVMAIFSMLGSVYLFVLTVKRKSYELLPFFSFPLVYFLYAGAWHTKFIRYMVPLLPFLLICGAYILVAIYSKWKLVGKIIISLCIFATILWALAFFSIYTRPQTRISASQWIYANIPAGSRIYTEHWDDGLPVSSSIFSASQYQSEALTIYDPDNDEKLSYYATKLANGQYIVINSRRLYGTLLRLTKEYPLTSQYYQLLFKGKLGYKQVAQFSSYPQILGISINDDASEETFQVYDHPKVLIFRNIDHLSNSEIKDLLRNAWMKY